MAMWPDFALKHRRQDGGDAIDHAIDIERHGLVEAVEIDVADVEGHVHAGAEKSEVDRPKLALHVPRTHLQGIRLQHVGGESLDVIARSHKRIELLARPRRSPDLDAGRGEPLRHLAADGAGRPGDPRHLPGKFVRHCAHPFDSRRGARFRANTISGASLLCQPSLCKNTRHSPSQVFRRSVPRAGHCSPAASRAALASAAASVLACCSRPDRNCDHGQMSS